MNRCRWPSERAATEHLVKFAAVTFAHGVRNIFFHAGTCDWIMGLTLRDEMVMQVTRNVLNRFLA